MPFLRYVLLQQKKFQRRNRKPATIGRYVQQRIYSFDGGEKLGEKGNSQGGAGVSVERRFRGQQLGATRGVNRGVRAVAHSVEPEKRVLSATSKEEDEESRAP